MAHSGRKLRAPRDRRKERRRHGPACHSQLITVEEAGLECRYLRPVLQVTPGRGQTRGNRQDNQTQTTLPVPESRGQKLRGLPLVWVMGADGSGPPGPHGLLLPSRVQAVTGARRGNGQGTMSGTKAGSLAPPRAPQSRMGEPAATAPAPTQDSSSKVPKCDCRHIRVCGFSLKEWVLRTLCCDLTPSILPVALDLTFQ